MNIFEGLNPQQVQPQVDKRCNERSEAILMPEPGSILIGIDVPVKLGYKLYYGNIEVTSS